MVRMRVQVRVQPQLLRWLPLYQPLALQAMQQRLTLLAMPPRSPWALSYTNKTALPATTLAQRAHPNAAIKRLGRHGLAKAQKCCTRLPSKASTPCLRAVARVHQTLKSRLPLITLLRVLAKYLLLKTELLRQV